MILLYFGPWPFWTPLFVMTCRLNSCVDWLFVGDQLPDVGDLPGSPRRLVMQPPELMRRIKAVLGRSPDLSRIDSYKVCDFRPMFGHLFASEIGAATYWGHVDNDVLWGDLASFLAPVLRTQPELVSVRPRKTTGHFTLYRNTDRINALYTRVPRMVRNILTPTYTAMDERGMTHYLLPREKLTLHYRLRRRWRAPFGSPVRAAWMPNVTTSGDDQCRVDDAAGLALRWEEGRTFDVDGREKMYLHFHKLKGGLRARSYPASIAPSTILITRHEIVVDPERSCSSAVTASVDAP